MNDAKERLDLLIDAADRVEWPRGDPDPPRCLYRFGTQIAANAPPAFEEVLRGKLDEGSDPEHCLKWLELVRQWSYWLDKLEIPTVERIGRLVSADEATSQTRVAAAGILADAPLRLSEPETAQYRHVVLSTIAHLENAHFNDAWREARQHSVQALLRSAKELKDRCSERLRSGYRVRESDASARIAGFFLNPQEERFGVSIEDIPYITLCCRVFLGHCITPSPDDRTTLTTVCPVFFWTSKQPRVEAKTTWRVLPKDRLVELTGFDVVRFGFPSWVNSDLSGMSDEPEGPV